MRHLTRIACLGLVVFLLTSISIVRAADCPRMLGCGVSGCACGDTVTADFTMNMNITCPQTFNDPTFGLVVNPGVTLNGLDPTTGQIHKIIGPGNPDANHPISPLQPHSDNVGIWLHSNGGTPSTVLNVEVSGFERGLQIDAGSNGNTLQNVATHDNGNFLNGNAHGYGIDVLGSDNIIDGCQVYHNADEGIHFSSSEDDGSIAPHGICSESSAACTRDGDCPSGQTCVVANGARNTVKSTVNGASQVYDNGRENLYVRITSATKITDTTSSFPGRCACSQASDCGTGGACGTTAVWGARCIKGAATACTTSADCASGHACLHGSSVSLTAYIKHSVDGIYRRDTFTDAGIQLVGNSRDNIFGRPDVTAGGVTLTNADLKFNEHPDDGGYPSGNRVRYSTITNPAGPCVQFRNSSVNTLDHVTYSCGGSWSIQTNGLCALNPEKDCGANGNDCVEQCDGGMCETSGSSCMSNSGCGCVAGHCDINPSVTCSTGNDCHLCDALLPQGPNEVCDTTLPTYSPAAPAPASLVLNGATCP